MTEENTEAKVEKKKDKSDDFTVFIGGKPFMKF